MDFDQLYGILPKYSTLWTTKDIENWLKFIGLQNYIEFFQTASVDGSCLSQLTEEDLKNELGITSKIIIKKLMAWISQGIKNYDIFLSKKEKKNTISQKIHSQIDTKQSKQHKLEEEGDTFEKIYDLQEHLSKSLIKKRDGTELQKQKKEFNELIIKQCDSNTAFGYYCLRQQGGIIGRNSKSQIHIMDENISRFHAQIDYQNGDYFLSDSGSSSGTFLKIIQKTALYHGQILELGSNQFLVQIINSSIMLKVIEGPNTNEVYELSKQSKTNIGRKSTNQISFIDDQHLSNIHSTIFQVQETWYIEDIGTTNGTWIRLSPEGVKSAKYLLKNQIQFKLGPGLIYQCQLSHENRKTEKDKSDKCRFCKISEKDCIFIPCKHNTCCFKCAKFNQIINCVNCGSTVTQIMKIFKV